MGCSDRTKEAVGGWVLISEGILLKACVMQLHRLARLGSFGRQSNGASPRDGTGHEEHDVGSLQEGALLAVAVVVVVVVVVIVAVVEVVVVTLLKPEESNIFNVPPKLEEKIAQCGLAIHMLGQNATESVWVIAGKKKKAKTARFDSPSLQNRLKDHKPTCAISKHHNGHFPFGFLKKNKRTTKNHRQKGGANSKPTYPSLKSGGGAWSLWALRSFLAAPRSAGGAAHQQGTLRPGSAAADPRGDPPGISTESGG